MAELSGYGFSYREMQVAIKVVGNTLFGTNWKLPRELESEDSDSDEEKDYEFDEDTIPSRKNIRKMLKK